MQRRDRNRWRRKDFCSGFSIRFPPLQCASCPPTYFKPSTLPSPLYYPHHSPPFSLSYHFLAFIYISPLPCLFPPSLLLLLLWLSFISLFLCLFILQCLLVSSSVLYNHLPWFISFLSPPQAYPSPIASTCLFTYLRWAWARCLASSWRRTRTSSNGRRE